MAKNPSRPLASSQGKPPKSQAPRPPFADPAKAVATTEHETANGAATGVEAATATPVQAASPQSAATNALNTEAEYTAASQMAALADEPVTPPPASIGENVVPPAASSGEAALPASDSTTVLEEIPTSDHTTVHQGNAVGFVQMFDPATPVDQLFKINEATLTFLRNERGAAFAHIHAMSQVRTPAEAISLQVAEFQRAAEASLSWIGHIVSTAGRLTVPPSGR